MNLDQAIQFYDNNINSLIEMSNGQKEFDQEMWKTFENITNDCYSIIEDSIKALQPLTLSNILSNNGRKALEYSSDYITREDQEKRAIQSFVIKLNDYISGRDLSQFRKYVHVQTNPDLNPDEYYVFDGFETTPHHKSTWEKRYEIVPVKITKDRVNILEFEDRLFDDELVKLFYIIEKYPRWYYNLKSKLGSWSQRNLPTVLRGLEGNWSRKNLPTIRSLLGMRENKKPYISNVLNENLEIRGFYSNTPQNLLEWHRDKEDRVIIVQEGSGWSLQKDNSLPFKLKPGMFYQIPAGMYHRLLREERSSDLLLIIEKKKRKKKGKDQNSDGKNDFEDVRNARMLKSGMSKEEIKKKHPELFEGKNKIKCPKCGTINRKGVKKCKKCGYPTSSEGWTAA